MSALISKCRHLLSIRLPDRHVLQHLLDGLDVGIDLLQPPGRDVAVEVAVEVDLVAHMADQAVLVVTTGGVSIQASGTFGEQFLDVVERCVVDGKAGRPASCAYKSSSPRARNWACRRSTFPLVGASTQSSRRSTVSGRMTSWYLPRLKLSRIRFATPQRKLTSVKQPPLRSLKPQPSCPTTAGCMSMTHSAIKSPTIAA